VFPGVSLEGKRAVLFDVDGTLVDSTETIIRGLGDAFEKYAGHRPSDDILKESIGMPLKEQMRMYQLHEPTCDQLREMIDYTIERYRTHGGFSTPFEPTVEAMLLMKEAGFKVAAVTSRNCAELQHLYADFPFATHFDCAVCASDVVMPKPNPECAILACDKLGVSPSESIYIGDSVFDMKCAHQAEIATIAVTYGAATEYALAAESPDLIVRSPEELLAWAREATRTLCVNERN
jgi:HAD superfamily hydrolase (TIGR01549 family)